MAAAGDVLETYTFSADIAQLMGVMVSTVYANKEIFLRELVSNASDALERHSHAAGPPQLQPHPDEELCIRVYPNAAEGTLTIEDTGIGMSRDDLVENLGTIARSKTKAFLEAATASGADPEVIGQFGIGFYSAYVISDRVKVVSRCAESEECCIWESTAGGAFTVHVDSLGEHRALRRGTKVICYVKEDQLQFLDSAHLRELLIRHSCFVNWPLYLYTERCHLEAGVSTDDSRVVVSRGWELISRIPAVWLEDPSRVAPQAYNQVYRWLEGNDSTTEALALHHIEHSDSHQVDFRALLFCAQRASSDVFDLAEGRTRGSRVRLFVRRIFVKEFDDLLPKWMTFARGVVDSDDLPLNISREHLQRESAVMRVISRLLTRQCFDMLEALTQDPARFTIFCTMFGQNLKLGYYEDPEHRQRVLPLLRFYSSESGDELVSLRQYVDRMRPTQRHILYITGRSRGQAMQSPLIEGFRRDGYEVLLLTDPADEFALQVLRDFEGWELMSATTVHAATEGTQDQEALPGRSRGAPVSGVATIRRFVTEALQSSGIDCDVDCNTSSGMVGTAFPAIVRRTATGKEVLELDMSHGLFEELATKLTSFESTGAAERDLIVLLHEMAVALTPDQLAENPERRRRAGEKLQDMVRRLDGAFRDADDDDLPKLPLEPLTTQGSPSEQTARRSTLFARWPSIGSPVRMYWLDRSRRGIITFMEEGHPTADVLLSASYGAESVEEEVEGVILDELRPLLPFETQQNCGGGPSQRAPGTDTWIGAVAAELRLLKGQGNELFNLKDYDAALETYTRAIELIQDSAAVEPGQVVLHVSRKDGRSQLLPATVRRVMCSHDGVKTVAELDGIDEDNCSFTCPIASLLPVLGLRSWKPLLERADAFRDVCGPLLDTIAAAAADPEAAELMALQAAVLTNRARCWSALACDQRAAQDLTVAGAAWGAFAACPLAKGAAGAATVKGLSTVEYLRAKSRLRRGLASAAARDVREALARQPPEAVARQLAELQHEVFKAMGERHRVKEPLARELAKAVFALRAAAL